MANFKFLTGGFDFLSVEWELKIPTERKTKPPPREVIGISIGGETPYKKLVQVRVMFRGGGKISLFL